MAELIINTSKIKDNIKYISQYLKKRKIKWSLITKVFSGDKEFLKNILSDDVIENINSVGDSRLTSLRNLKEVNSDMRTIYIKPPAKIYADDVVEYADISLNSSFETIQALSNSAKAKNKVHKIIIMVEMGELREGVNQEDVLDFYSKVFNLENIEIQGIGSNLGCMYGIIPTVENLKLLSSYKNLISEKFNQDLPLISGGTSITLPLVENNSLPKEINHFRIGEAAFFGLTPYDGSKFKELNTDTFSFNANILELEEKSLVPEGIISDANIGHTKEISESSKDTKSHKAIIDIGMLDVDKADLSTTDKELTFVGVTSDMLVLDIGKNIDENGNQKYKAGGNIPFGVNYMAVARLLNSKFIDRKFV
jgi:predicted amino acid racemase